MKIYIILIMSLFVLNNTYAQSRSIPEIDYYFENELLDGRAFSGNLPNRKEIYKYYGIPLEEIIETSKHLFYVAIRKLIYSDLIHNFYISEGGSETYNGFVINKPLERLKMINIGDNINKLIETFGSMYWEGNNYGYEHYILYDGLKYAGIIFYIENNIIIKIEGLYFYWE
jgi:hypothetical protein